MQHGASGPRISAVSPASPQPSCTSNPVCSSRVWARRPRQASRSGCLGCAAVQRKGVVHGFAARSCGRRRRSPGPRLPPVSCGPARRRTGVRAPAPPWAGSGRDLRPRGRRPAGTPGPLIYTAVAPIPGSCMTNPGDRVSPLFVPYIRYQHAGRRERAHLHAGGRRARWPLMRHPGEADGVTNATNHSAAPAMRIIGRDATGSTNPVRSTQG